MMGLLAEGETSYIWVLVLLVCIGMLLFRVRRQLGKLPRFQPALVHAPRYDDAPASSHAGLPGELAKWEVQLHDLARDYKAEMDSKMGLLQHLIADAAAQSDRLETLLSQAKSLTPEGGREGQSAAISQPPISHDEKPPVDPTAAGSPSSQGVGLPSRDAIYAMADSGVNPEEIARRLGNPVGEVALILSQRAD